MPINWNQSSGFWLSDKSGGVTWQLDVIIEGNNKNQEQFANTRIFIVFSNYILHSPRKLKSWAPFCTHTTPLINEEKQ